MFALHPSPILKIQPLLFNNKIVLTGPLLSGRLSRIQNIDKATLSKYYGKNNTTRKFPSITKTQHPIFTQNFASNDFDANKNPSSTNQKTVKEILDTTWKFTNEKVLTTAKDARKKYWNENNTATTKELGLAIVYGTWGIITALLKACIPRRFRYKNIAGQIILITGAGSGIGKLMAKSLALEHGAIVISWDINEEGNKETVNEIRSCGGKCFSYKVDVTSPEAIYASAKEVLEDIGKVDIIINNAGLVSGKLLLETSDIEIIKLFQVNVMSNFWVTKAFLPDMIRTGRGHIVTISSLGGLIGINQLVDYCSSKFATVGFHRALMNELNCNDSTKCINTTLVCPYYIDTGMFDGVHSKIIPIQRPQAVTDDIVAGILCNQETVVIPRYIYLLVLFHNIVPAAVGQRFTTAFGITSTMSNFKGRQVKNVILAAKKSKKKK